jgi:hypothetical protein
MFEQRYPSSLQYRTYEVDADDFNLYDGDWISPGYEIGVDVRSGANICMEMWGQVATVYYNPMNHSYLVMIQLLNDIDKAFVFAESEQEISLA